MKIILEIDEEKDGIEKAELMLNASRYYCALNELYNKFHWQWDEGENPNTTWEEVWNMFREEIDGLDIP